MVESNVPPFFAVTDAVSSAGSNFVSREIVIERHGVATRGRSRRGNRDMIMQTYIFSGGGDLVD